jgi:hypothetical protein
MLDTATRQRLGRLATAQDGVVRRSQLARIGISYESVEAQIAALRWQAVGPVVVVLHNGPLTAAQQRWAVVLNAGKGAALAGRTAASEGGLTGWASVGVEVLVPRGAVVAKLPQVPDMVVHESRRFGPRDIHPAVAPARTRMDRSLLDGAAWTKDRRAASGLLCAGVQQKLTTASHLRKELMKAGQIRHRTLLRATIEDIAGGAQALSEIDAVKILRKHRVPVTVERQEVRRDRHGKRRYLDLTLRTPDGRVLRVEIDGAVHLLPLTYWEDMLRGNEFLIAGDPLLRFATLTLRLDEAVFVDQIRRAAATCQARVVS